MTELQTPTHDPRAFLAGGAGWLMWAGVLYTSFFGRVSPARHFRWFVGCLTVLFFSTAIGWASCPHADRISVFTFDWAIDGVACGNPQRWRTPIFQTVELQSTISSVVDVVTWAATPALIVASFALMLPPRPWHRLSE